VVNPREAQLADAAAGIHVRFRLGGTTFPPLVFYKVPLTLTRLRSHSALAEQTRDG
jgi:hypothetical protein